MIGEFEFFLLSAAAQLGNEAYGAAVLQKVGLFTGRRCSVGALYTTLDRLEKKGLLTTWMGEPTPERGGRAKRMINITPAGLEAVQAFYRAVVNSSRNAPWALPDQTR